MNDLTHEQIRRFLLPARLACLTPVERQELEAHLAECGECRVYAAESEALQERLHHVLHARWDPIPGPASSYAPSVLAHTRSQTMFRNTLRVAGSLILGILLIAAVAGIINTFRPQPAAQPYGVPLPSGTETAPSLPESTPQAAPARLSDSFHGLIAFQSERDGNSEIYIIQSDGGSPTNLTRNPADDGTPAWSPDGKRIAFSSDRSGKTELYVMDADGGDLTQLTYSGEGVGWTIGPLEWSPDGKYILAMRDTGITQQSDGEHTFFTYESSRLYLVNTDGSGGRYLVENEPKNPGYGLGPAWSPDGSRIAVTLDMGGEDALVVIHIDGTEAAEIDRAKVPTWPVFPSLAWSPDGSRLAYFAVKGGYSHLIVANSDGSDSQTILKTTLLEDGQPTPDEEAYKLKTFVSLRWSPDGSRLLYLSDENADECWTLHLINSDGSGLVEVPSLCDRGAVPDASWTPDGKWILWSASEGPGGEKSAILALEAAEAMRDPASIKPDHLTDPDGQDLFPRPQPETTSVVAAEPQVTPTVSASPSPTNMPGIWDIPFTPLAPRLGRNGLIAFTTNQDRNSEIYVMNPDGSGQRNLTNNLANDWWPVWSHDGKWLAFLSDRTGVSEIYTVNADGTGLQQLTRNTFPITNSGDGSEYENPNEPPYPIWETPSWSPDGKYLAATLWKGPYTSEDFYLARIAADGSGVTYIQNGPFFNPQWSPDGSLLAAVCRYAQQDDICILDPINLQADGTAQSTNITNTPAWNETGILLWAPDGSSLAYVAFLAPETMSYGVELREIERSGWKQRTLFTFQLLRSGSISLDEYAWSPDGKRLALIFPPSSSPKANHIYLINADGSGLVDLGQTEYDPSHLRWSPDGQFLLFGAGALVSEQDASGKQVIARDESAIWVLDVEAALSGGAIPVRLTSKTGMVGWPEWQPIP